MNNTIYVHLLPQLCQPDDFRGSVAVVIDILRATTTITHALAQGAKVVFPAQEVESAQSLASELPDEKVLLGGERKGEKIPGFDLDNSPLAYTEEAVSGKSIVFTTTNGTRALAHCEQASSIYLGAFSSISPLVQQLKQHEEPIHLLCAGTDGKITWEDVLFAGAVVNGMQNTGSVSLGNDEARLALDSFVAQSGNAGQFYQALATSQGGSNLVDLGFDHDIQRAAEWDLYEIVPKYDPDSGKITALVDNITKLIEKLTAPK